MTTLTVKIVGTEGDSVLVKYVSENSAKPIDEYEPVAYQPKHMGYDTKEEFLKGIEKQLLAMVEARDYAESSTADLDSWADDTEVTSEVVAEETIDVPTIPDTLDTQKLPDPEVIL